MERKGKWTRGPVTAEYQPDMLGNDTAEMYIKASNYREVCRLDPDMMGVPRVEWEPNASLIASAFNSATTCEDMGYDGEACVKALPELVVAMNGLARAYASTTGAITAPGSWHSHAVDILARCRG